MIIFINCQARKRKEKTSTRYDIWAHPILEVVPVVAAVVDIADTDIPCYHYTVACYDENARVGL